MAESNSSLQKDFENGDQVKVYNHPNWAKEHEVTLEKVSQDLYTHVVYRLERQVR